MKAEGLAQEAITRPFLARQLAVDLAPGHLSLGSTIETGDFLRAHPQGGAQAIRSGVPAADHRHAPADGRPPLPIGRKPGRIDVAANEELRCLVDTRKVVAGDLHIGIDTAPYPYKDNPVTLIQELINGRLRSHARPCR